LIFSGRSFWQKSAEDIGSEQQLKRKHEDAVSFSYVKKHSVVGAISGYDHLPIIKK
jgi:hypothetical protein